MDPQQLVVLDRDHLSCRDQVQRLGHQRVEFPRRKPRDAVLWDTHSFSNPEATAPAQPLRVDEHRDLRMSTIASEVSEVKPTCGWPDDSTFTVEQ